MTCIVGLKHNGRVYVGGDKASTRPDGVQTIIADSKVFTNGPFVMGITGQPRVGQLMEFAFAPPPHDPQVDIHRYMVTTFVDSVRQTFKAAGLARREWEQEVMGSGLLIGYRGRLFRMFSAYDIEEAADPFAAFGAGSEVARGALYASEGKEPCRRVCLALEAAERVKISVRRPFTIVCQVTRSAAAVEYHIIEVDACMVNEDDHETDLGTPYSPAA